MRDVLFSYDSLDFYPGSHYIETVHAGRIFQAGATINTEADYSDLLDPKWQILCGFRGGNGRHDVVFDTGDATGYFTRYRDASDVYIRFAAKDQTIADELVERTVKIAPPVNVVPDGTVKVSFWSCGANGPMSINRKIEVENWADISRNYAGETVPQVEQLMSTVPPFESGRLILWHGVPGTGKSHAIRALIKHWQPWCDVNYIVDPDVLFRSAASLMTLLLDNDGYGRVDPAHYPEETFILQGEDRWRIFIMEDCDEFLQADAKSRQGQALSRLLNIADGFIGQGLKIVFLITTNEKLKNIHGAVSRTGRCAANTEFGKFSREEAYDWLGYKDDSVTGETTLSDLYDKQRKQQQIKVEKETTQQIGQYL